MSEKCPFCGEKVSALKGETPMRFICGTRRIHQDHAFQRSNPCYETEIAALRSELAAKSECMEDTLSDCHELIKQNAALKALVQEAPE